jgi:hypothetical protein
MKKKTAERIQKCYSCEFMRKCTEYKEIWLCTRCKKEAKGDARHFIGASSIF